MYATPRPPQRAGTVFLFYLTPVVRTLLDRVIQWCGGITRWGREGFCYSNCRCMACWIAALREETPSLL
jgi:hypothetical protein